MPAARTILVVEDEVLIRLMIAEDLLRAGYNVVQASNGGEALRVLQSPVDVGLVLTDLRMPGKPDGVELVSRVRARWPHLKIVILSAQHQNPVEGASADAFLTKPYNPAKLLDRIGQLLDRGDDRA